jgi:hypothetical protein
MDEPPKDQIVQMVRLRDTDRAVHQLRDPGPKMRVFRFLLSRVDPSTSTPLPNLLQRRGLASGYSSPESTLTRVDFLALFSPSKACASPAHTAQSTQSCTTRAPPRLTRPCVSRSGDCLPDGALGAGGPFRSPRIARPRVLWWRNSGIGPHTLDRLQDLLGRRRRVERRVNAVIRHARHGIANREEYRE